MLRCGVKLESYVARGTRALGHEPQSWNKFMGYGTVRHEHRLNCRIFSKSPVLNDGKDSATLDDLECPVRTSEYDFPLINLNESYYRTQESMLVSNGT